MNHTHHPHASHEQAERESSPTSSYAADVRIYPREVDRIDAWNRSCDPGHRIPSYSPWGQVDAGRVLADGITQVYTAGHGGIHLDEHRLREIGARTMPDSIRHADGWYEEDCDWASVAAVYPHAFPSWMYDQTKLAMEQWHGKAWAHLLANDIHIREHDTQWQASVRRFYVDNADTQLIVYEATENIPKALRHRIREDALRNGQVGTLDNKAWLLVRTGKEVYAPPPHLTFALIDKEMARVLQNLQFRTAGSYGWCDPYPKLLDIQPHLAQGLPLLQIDPSDDIRIRDFWPYGVSLPENRHFLNIRAMSP